MSAVTIEKKPTVVDQDLEFSDDKVVHVWSGTSAYRGFCGANLWKCGCPSYVIEKDQINCRCGKPICPFCLLLVDPEL